MLAIETEGLTKEYRRGFFRRRHLALDRLDLQVPEGEVFGFLGPNGAGKSTTFKLLMGLSSPTAGSARILGRDIGSRGARRPAGFLPEDAYFYTYLTGREMLRFYGRLQGIPVPEVRAREDGLLEKVGLAAARDVRLGEYSKGMRQRFGLAQALVADPRVLFLDEPLTGLDPLGRKFLKDLILGLRAEGRTIFFSSHILADAEAICDRVGILISGRLVKCGKIEELLAGTARTFDLAVEGLEAAAVGGLGHQVFKTEGAMVWARIAPGKDPDQAVGEVRAAGGKVRALIPYRESLEEYFVQAAGGAARQGEEGPAKGEGP
jgi:ABC-2 type transport system ATP-binding protein